MPVPRLSRLGLSVCFALAARAQFAGWSTTDDGSRLYFATRFRLKGTTQSLSSKVFVADGSGIRLYSDSFPGFPTGADMVAPQVSSDGSVVAYTGTYATDQCGPHASFLCPTPPLIHYATLIQPAGSPPILVDGQARISANGRYVLMQGPALLDLTTGARTMIPVSANSFVPFILVSVASDGTVLLSNIAGGETYYYIWRQDLGTRQIALPGGYALMDDSATKLAYSVTNYVDRSLQNLTYTYTLYLMDLATGLSQIIANGTASSISRDGQWIAFLSPGTGVSQAYVVRADGEALRQVTEEPGGIAHVFLSGSSDVAFAITTSNRILKIDISSGATTEIAPATVVASPPIAPDGVVPGSQHVLRVTGLATDILNASPPLPSELGGIRVLMNGAPAPILSVSPAEVRYQVPWETSIGASVVVDVPGAIFELPISLPLSAFWPVFETNSCTNPLGITQCVAAVHQDSGLPVSKENPARSGENVDLYLHGLGPVVPPVANGEAAPVNPPAILQHPITCRLEQYSQPPPPPAIQSMPILTAKLAPQTIGVYAVTVKFPPQLGFSMSNIKCGSPDGLGGYASAWIFTFKNLF